MITLLHPSRGRAAKAKATKENWLANAGCDVEYILSIDTSDPDGPNYMGNASHIILKDNKSVVDATNHAASQSSGEILVYLSDDFECPENWGKLLLKEFEGVKTPMLLKVDDCLQGFTVPVLTIPIMNRALYNRLGYFWHPGYRSMFVDESLYWTCMKLNAIKFCPHLKFPHLHPANGKAANDETYSRSAANWDQGKALFAHHKSQGFPV